MDLSATLREMIFLANEIRAGQFGATPIAAYRLAELVDALDEGIMRGMAPPSRWPLVREDDGRVHYDRT